MSGYCDANGTPVRGVVAEAHFDARGVAWWVETAERLGIERKDFRPPVLIARSPSGEYEVHLSEFVRDEHGLIFLDFASNAPVTRPRIIPLGSERTWPDDLPKYETPVVGAL